VKNNKTKIALFFGLALIAFVLVFYINSNGSSDENASRPKIFSTNWQDKYIIKSNDPYGLNFYFKQLKQQLGKKASFKTINNQKQLSDGNPQGAASNRL